MTKLDRMDDEGRTYRAQVRISGAASLVELWIGIEQGQPRLRLFDTTEKFYAIASPRIVPATAMQGTWTMKRPRVTDALDKAAEVESDESSSRSHHHNEARRLAPIPVSHRRHGISRDPHVRESRSSLGTHLEPTPDMSRIAWLVLASSLVGVAPAHGDVRGVVRFGVLPLELEASRDTTFFGDDIGRAVDAYNRAADAYDQRYGGRTERVAAGDLGVDDTLITFAPGFEAGGDLLFFRLEGQVGLGDDLRSLGVGVYPLNVQAKLSREMTAYVSAGGSASWLDREGSDLGGLLSARAAGGVRISERIVVEAGYGAFMIGGVVDNDVLDDYTPSPDAPPPSPRQVVAAGEATGVVDLSVGVVF